MKLYMIRSTDGALYDVFAQRNLVALAWPMLAQAAVNGLGKKELTEIFIQSSPEIKLRSAQSGAAQVWRFVNELTIGDLILTYSPLYRRYRLGKITGNASHHPEWDNEKMSLTRQVEWLNEISRDDLSAMTQKALGAVATLFAVSNAASAEIFQTASIQSLAF